MDWALPAILESLAVQRRVGADLVWVTAPHTRNLFVGYCVARLVNKPLVLDIRDPWTYGSIWMPWNEKMADVERYWARRILDAAQRIVFTSPLTAEEMGRRFPRAAHKMRTITNGYADLGDPEPLRVAPASSCLFSYAGSLNPRRTPEVLLQALQLANREPGFASSARLQFVGGMAGYETLSQKYGVENQVIDIGRVTQKDSVRYMCGADVNVLLQTIDSGQDVIAGKSFEYIAAGKPILGVCSLSGGDAWLLRQVPASSVVPFDSPEAVAAGMLELWRARRHPGSGEQPRGGLDVERFSRRHLTSELAHLFDEVLGPR
jgi:glycosyltransferase involved in cell wall biosynthesis